MAVDEQRIRELLKQVAAGKRDFGEDAAAILETLVWAPSDQKAVLFHDSEWPGLATDFRYWSQFLRGARPFMERIGSDMPDILFNVIGVYSVLSVLSPESRPPYNGAAKALEAFYVRILDLPKSQEATGAALESLLWSNLLRHPTDVEHVRNILRLLCSGPLKLDLQLQLLQSAVARADRRSRYMTGLKSPLLTYFAFALGGGALGAWAGKHLAPGSEFSSRFLLGTTMSYMILRLILYHRSVRATGPVPVFHNLLQVQNGRFTAACEALLRSRSQ